MKNIINGMNMVITESRFPNNNSPWLAKMQNTARDKNQICSGRIRMKDYSFKLSSEPYECH